jgi:hypothetical protein
MRHTQEHQSRWRSLWLWQYEQVKLQERRLLARLLRDLYRIQISRNRLVKAQRLQKSLAEDLICNFSLL